MYAYGSMHMQLSQRVYFTILKLIFKIIISPPWPRNDAAQHTYLWSGHPLQGLLVVNFLVMSLSLGEGLVT